MDWNIPWSLSYYFKLLILFVNNYWVYTFDG